MGLRVLISPLPGTHLPCGEHFTAKRSDALSACVVRTALGSRGQTPADRFVWFLRRPQPKSWDTVEEKRVVPSWAAQHRLQVRPT